MAEEAVQSMAVKKQREGRKVRREGGREKREREGKYGFVGLLFLSLFHLIHQPMEWCCPHSGGPSPLVNPVWKHTHHTHKHT